MSNFIRGLVAVPAFLAYGAVAFAIGGTKGIGGVILLALGAVAVGYAIGSPSALLIALPFAVWGVATLGDPGPIENTDTGLGVLILALLAGPVLLGAAAGAVARAGVRHDRRH